VKSINKIAQQGYTHLNKVRLLQGGNEFFQFLSSMIDRAEHVIYFQFYIFDEDDTGRMIAVALKAAAQRNVSVHLLLDGYASKKLTLPFIQDLKEAGIKFRWFTSFLKNRKFYLGRRLHHKVIVVDGTKSLVCGLNISDRYNDTVGNTAWLDWAIYTEGEASLELEQICKKRIKDNASRSIIALNPASELLSKKNSCSVKIGVNDWVSQKSDITRSYLEMLKNASSHIIIMTPYFMPGLEFRKRLRLASAHGVKIKLILTGISDIPLAKYAERYLYDWLFRHNIQIYEYQKNVLHGKIATCDNHWVTVGSYNVNNLSAYASIELNMEVKNDEFASLVESRLISIMDTKCILITKESYKNEINILKRIVQVTAYNLLRIMLMLFTFRKNQQN
jgi:cardiolipin synthase